MTPFKVCARLFVLLCLICQSAANAWAQAYPSKVVRMIVPFTAGSGADTISRIVAGGLAEVWGQQVVIENRGGAAGNIGMEIASRAPADGYTLAVANLSHAANVTLYGNLPYDLVRDFSPVTQATLAAFLVLVHPSVPVKSINEFLSLVKARSGAIDYGSAGTGTPTFLAVELLKAQAGLNMVHVPYRGGGEAMTAVISGEVPVYFGPVAPSLPHVRSGRLRALAITSAKRLPTLPDYPTIAESGYPGYELSNWTGLLVPVKAPKETIAAIRNATVKALNNPAVSKRLNDLGYTPVGDQPEEFAAYIKSEIGRLAKVITQLKLKAK